jgi:hypothetical protein
MSDERRGGRGADGVPAGPGLSGRTEKLMHGDAEWEEGGGRP